jgi:putative ABC transport system permease protein
MSVFDRFPRRFRLPWRTREQISAEVDEELAFHLEMRVEELVREGLDPGGAHAIACREFGDVEAAKRYLRRADETRERERRRTGWLDELLQNVRFAIRMLR